MSKRQAGVLVPLFSIPSSASWGVGEITDLAPFARWARSAGLSAIQLLPINEMAHGQSSPYSALSAMAIDPIFIGVGELPEFHAAGREAGLTASQRERLEGLRQTTQVNHQDTRELKTEVLRGLSETSSKRTGRPARAGGEIQA